jgi:acetyl/propionyl-CoA carboxylase alpha subunit
MRAGTPTIPGSPGPVATAAEAVAAAKTLGFPVMLKAASGGGGKGLRVVRQAADLASAFDLTRGEVGSAFGDDTVFVEKFIERPRHIEIQVLGDGKGNVVHFGERECSLQRRHQKVVEEAPSLWMTPERRRAMGAAAVLLARAVNYRWSIR